MLKKFLIILIISLFLNSLFVFKSFAFISEGDILLNISPKYPRSNENVRASIESYLLDTNTSYFIWTLNDKVVFSGVGKNYFNFTLGDNASQNILSVRIETKEGKVYSKTMTLYSGDVDLLWEAIDSYAPPFYKGKTLFAREGELKITALPSVYSNNTKNSQHTLSYFWNLDNDNQNHVSGFGKNYFIFKNGVLNKYNKIGVIVSDINKETRISKEITISPFTPKILFYKKNNLNINLEKIIENNHYINKEGETIVAIPYFFSPNYVHGLNISWFINNEEVKPYFKNELSIKPENNLSGEALINVNIANENTLFQEAKKSIKVNF